jgi:hypothetical protein
VSVQGCWRTTLAELSEVLLTQFLPLGWGDSNSQELKQPVILRPVLNFYVLFSHAVSSAVASEWPDFFHMRFRIPENIFWERIESAFMSWPWKSHSFIVLLRSGYYNKIPLTEWLTP